MVRSHIMMITIITAIIIAALLPEHTTASTADVKPRSPAALPLVDAPPMAAALSVSAGCGLAGEEELAVAVPDASPPPDD